MCKFHHRKQFDDCFSCGNIDIFTWPEQEDHNGKQLHYLGYNGKNKRGLFCVKFSLSFKQSCYIGNNCHKRDLVACCRGGKCSCFSGDMEELFPPYTVLRSSLWISIYRFMYRTHHPTILRPVQGGCIHGKHEIILFWSFNFPERWSILFLCYCSKYYLYGHRKMDSYDSSILFNKASRYGHIWSSSIDSAVVFPRPLS